jgi:hypothetical protein
LKDGAEIKQRKGMVGLLGPLQFDQAQIAMELFGPQRRIAIAGNDPPLAEWP